MPHISPNAWMFRAVKWWVLGKVSSFLPGSRVNSHWNRDRGEVVYHASIPISYYPRSALRRNPNRCVESVKDIERECLKRRYTAQISPHCIINRYRWPDTMVWVYASLLPHSLSPHFRCELSLLPGSKTRRPHPALII